MRIQPGHVAVVTGAASGIGKAIALALADRGCRLALVDLDEAGLRELQGALPGRAISLHVTDVAERQQMERLPGEVVAVHGAVHLLVNNAGVSLAGPLEAVSLDDLEWIVGVNFWGTVYGCRLFLPHLRRQNAAHIVNILSDFAILGFPTKTAYCATKFGVRGFSEALRAELHRTGVGVTCVYPGPADTNIARKGRAVDSEKQALEARFLAERGIPLEVIAARTLTGVDRNAARVLIGRETYAFDLVKRLAPEWADRMVARVSKRVPFL